MKGIGFNRFTDADVVRHPLVQRIVVAYEKSDIEKEDRMSLRPPSEFTPEPGAAAAKSDADETTGDAGTRTADGNRGANSDGGNDVESQH